MLFFITLNETFHTITVLGRSLKGMSVDDFLGAGFMEEEDQDVSLRWCCRENPNVMYVQDDEPNDEGPGTEDEDEDNTDVDMDDDNASFASVDELDSAPLEK
jgi:nucleolar complex protein 2